MMRYILKISLPSVVLVLAIILSGCSLEERKNRVELKKEVVDLKRQLHIAENVPKEVRTFASEFDENIKDCWYWSSEPYDLNEKGKPVDDRSEHVKKMIDSSCKNLKMVLVKSRRYQRKYADNAEVSGFLIEKVDTVIEEEKQRADAVLFAFIPVYVSAELERRGIYVDKETAKQFLEKYYNAEKPSKELKAFLKATCTKEQYRKLLPDIKRALAKLDGAAKRVRLNNHEVAAL